MGRCMSEVLLLMGCIDGFSAHMLKSKGGSIRVNRAVKKHGLEIFAFLVIETTSIVKKRNRNPKDGTKIYWYSFAWL